MITPCQCHEAPAPDRTLATAMAAFQLGFIHTALQRHGWNVTATARELGISRKHLTMLIDRHQLIRPPK